MAEFQFSSSDAEFMGTLSEQLEADLRLAGLDAYLQIGPAVTTEAEPTRGDPITWATIALTAAGTGGALSVLLGKDGFLSALARVLEKYVEGRRVEVSIETEAGEKIKIKGPVGEIKAILKQARK